MASLANEIVERRMRAVDNAIAQQELEGMRMPDATVADLIRAARGEITDDELIRNILGRIEQCRAAHQATTTT